MQANIKSSPSDRPRVVIAMSGGVDSSVAAALLLEQGYDVVGMMLRLWSEPGTQASNRCCTPESMGLARRVAAKLGIPFYAIDIQENFRQIIVEYFVDGYAQGITPNPCLICNRQIRFGLLLERALAIDADYLATGHYARLDTGPDHKIRLLRGVDPAKDQSYVLSVLNQNQLGHALFPVGIYLKQEVRALADKYQLPVADRADSQDLCFLAGDDYRNFLFRNRPDIYQNGMIRNRQGERLGEHTGLANYTIGQRKGLGIQSQVPLYVIEKDMATNSLIVGEGNELGRQELLAGPVNWVSGEPPPEPIQTEVKIRYKALEARGMLTPLQDQMVRVHFDTDLRDITPGQSAVFYQGEVCLGGGVIQN